MPQEDLATGEEAARARAPTHRLPWRLRRGSDVHGRRSTVVWQASFVSYKLVPNHLRIPYVSCVSFVWTTVLSIMQGRFREASREASREAAAS